MTAAGWTTIRASHLHDRPAVIRALFALGAEGVQELESEVVTSLRDSDVVAVTEAIRRADPQAEVATSPTPVVDWSLAWRDRIVAHRLGRIVVTPPWLADRFTAEERVVIDPGMAFGTGDHETTRGVIRLLQRTMAPGDTVADLGAGSAVLAIAAAKLGAARAIAVELDPDAIGNAEENVERNGVGDRVTVIEGDAAALLPLIAPVQLILANIISSVLVELLPVMKASLAPGGKAILSGILVEERAVIEAAAGAGGWRVDADDVEGMWWSAVLLSG